MKISIESEESDYEKIIEFADELTEKILDDERLTISNDIEITDIVIDEIENHNPEENIYMEEDDE